MKRTSFFALIVVLLLAGVVSATPEFFEEDLDPNMTENRDYRVAVFKGWDMFGEDSNQLYIFDPPGHLSDPYRFVVDIDNRTSGEPMTWAELRSALEGDYTPVIIEFFAKTERLEARMVALSTETTIFRPGKLSAWQTEFGLRAHGSRRLESYWIYSYPGSVQHMVFLLPAEFVSGPVTVSFRYEPTTMSLTAPSDERGNVLARIAYYESELTRLRALAD